MDFFSGIVNKFNKAVKPPIPRAGVPVQNILSSGVVKIPKPAAAMTTKQLLQGVGPGVRSVVPGATATKTVLNAPAVTKAGSALGGTSRLIGGALGAASIAGMSPGSTPLAGTAGEYNPGPLLKMTGEFPFVHMRGSEQNPERTRPTGMSNLGADYAQQEKKLATEALISTAQQNRKRQLAAGGVPGQLPSDYKETEAAAFRAAAEKGDPQTPEIRRITAATGTDTSSGDRESLRAAGGDPAYAAWAKANPTLVAEVLRKGPKQAGYNAIEDVAFGAAAAPKAKELTEADMASYDNLETFKPSEMKARDRQDPIAGRDNTLNSYFPGARAPYSEEAFAAKLQDAQVFEGGINPNEDKNVKAAAQSFLKSRMNPRNR